MALTGKIELAPSFKAAREMIEEVELLNEVAIVHLIGGDVTSDETPEEPTPEVPVPGEPTPDKSVPGELKNDEKKGEASTVVIIASSIGAITCCVGLSVVVYWSYRRFASNLIRVAP